MNSVPTQSVTQAPVGSFAALQENAEGLGRLRIALLGLLPKDGTPMTIAQLAQAACVSSQQVSDALFDDYMDGRLVFNVRADTFAAIKQGSALPASVSNPFIQPT